jgi:hypothetical protein
MLCTGFQWVLTLSRAKDIHGSHAKECSSGQGNDVFLETLSESYTLVKE